MKRERRWQTLFAWLLAWTAAAADVGCLVTAFRMEVDSFLGLMLLCGAGAVWGSLIFWLPWGDMITACLLALTAGYLSHSEGFGAHFSALLQCVTRRYDMAYGWGTVALIGFDGTGAVDLALGVIGCLAALSVSWTVTRRKSALCALPGMILPLAACLVVTDTVPTGIWLYLLMLSVVVLLLTDHVRRKHREQSARLTAYVLLPVAAALGLLFLLMPQKNYVNNAKQYEERLNAWVQQLLSLPGEGGNSVAQVDVDLSAVGPRSRWNYTAMEVTSTQSGLTYLRGRDYDVYSGNGWSVSEERTELFGGGTETGTITIKTQGRKRMRYVPYYPAGQVNLVNGQLANDNTRYYSYALTRETDTALGNGPWLELPESTRRWAERLTAGILAEKTADQTDVGAIADFIRGSAVYDLNTPRMPGDEGDFARWFLEESDTGYCVHFATAAVVLLRAAGVPARYVTGYVADCVADKTVEVPERNAHAWAEYYSTAKNAWVILETTPADLTAPVETVTAPSESLAPEESQQPTESGPSQTAPSRQPEAPDKTESLPSKNPTRKAPRWLGRVLWWMLGLCALLGQGAVRYQLDRSRWNRGRANARALERWRQVRRISARLGAKPPKALDTLAQKAKFSQHTLTAQELEAFELWRNQALNRLRKRPLLTRLRDAVVFGIW